jgi:hypothetical protein
VLQVVYRVIKQFLLGQSADGQWHEYTINLPQAQSFGSDGYNDVTIPGRLVAITLRYSGSSSDLGAAGGKSVVLDHVCMLPP